MNTKISNYYLSKAVRNGRCGTDPKSLTRFLSICNAAADSLPRNRARQLQIEVMNLIMETVCDDLVAKCWRGWCLDNIYIPLQNVRKMSISTEEKHELFKLESQMRTLSQYFLA